MKNKVMIKKFKINTRMTLITGLHIGAGSDNVEIGGIDRIVLRRAIDNIPYIPGSSLKGKIRSLLEQIAGAAEIGGSESVNKLFGTASDNVHIPSKLIVRDSYMSNESNDVLAKSEFTDMPFTEIKFENSISRVEGKATNPRQTERIPAGTSFDVEFIINVWDNEEDGEKSFELLKKGIAALENDYLGGSGSRGYGQVRFGQLEKEEISFENYFTDEG